MDFDLDPQQLVMMYVTTETDKDLVEECPPQVTFEVHPAALAAVVDNAKRVAYRYDMYKTVLQVSFLSAEGFKHVLLCDDHEQETMHVVDEHRELTVVDTEAALMRKVCEIIRGMHMDMQPGVPMLWRMFAGWKIRSDIWPMLANKAFVHDAHLPASLTADPVKKWSTNNFLLDMSNIYSQGMSMNMRPLPSLPDVLRYWGYGSNGANSHPTTAQICNQICEDPVDAAGKIETYLRDMTDVVARYYRWRPNEQSQKLIQALAQQEKVHGTDD